MDPRLRRRILVSAGILAAIVAMAVVVALQPGTSLRTKWELARVRAVEKRVVVFLVPNASLRDDATTGWRIGALRPVEPVWRYGIVTLRLLPGCEIVLPSGETLLVSGSAESTTAAAFGSAATAAMTVDAAVTNGGRDLLCRRVTVGVPRYGTIESDLRRGAKSADQPAVGATPVTARAAFQRLDGEDVLVLTIPVKQSEGSFSGTERQYAILQPDTLYIARDDVGILPITFAEAKRLVRKDPSEFVDVDLEQRGQGVFVVQMRVRAN